MLSVVGVDDNLLLRGVALPSNPTSFPPKSGECDPGRALYGQEGAVIAPGLVSLLKLSEPSQVLIFQSM